jgi:hypothetical protein
MSLLVHCQKCGNDWNGLFVCKLGYDCGLAHIMRVLAQPKVFADKPKPSERRIVDGVIVEGPPS